MYRERYRLRINFKLILMTYKLNHHNCFLRHYKWESSYGGALDELSGLLISTLPPTQVKITSSPDNPISCSNPLALSQSVGTHYEKSINVKADRHSWKLQIELKTPSAIFSPSLSSATKSYKTLQIINLYYFFMGETVIIFSTT